MKFSDVYLVQLFNNEHKIISNKKILQCYWKFEELLRQE